MKKAEWLPSGVYASLHRSLNFYRSAFSTIKPRLVSFLSTVLTLKGFLMIYRGQNRESTFSYQLGARAFSVYCQTQVPFWILLSSSVLRPDHRELCFSCSVTW